MKIENITVGQHFKNYKALAQALDEPVLGGNAKKAQIKDWGRYFVAKKSGNSFTIEHIYDGVLPAQANKRNSVFKEDVQWILMQMLKCCAERNFGKNDVITVATTNYRLMVACALINSNYYATDDNIQIMRASHSNLVTLHPNVIADFYYSLRALVDGVIDSAVHDLERNKYIVTTKCVAICDFGTVKYIIKGAELAKYNEICVSVARSFTKKDGRPCTKYYDLIVNKHLKKYKELVNAQCYEAFKPIIKEMENIGSGFSVNEFILLHTTPKTIEYAEQYIGERVTKEVIESVNVKAIERYTQSDTLLLRKGDDRKAKVNDDQRDLMLKGYFLQLEDEDIDSLSKMIECGDNWFVKPIKDDMWQYVVNEQ